MTILFPSEPFTDHKEIDYSFKAEYEAAKLVGFKVFLFDHDEFVRTGDIIKMNLPAKADYANAPLILRSWMLKEDNYKCLYDRLLFHGYKLINSPEEYLNCHHFPEVYKHIAEHTSKAWWSNAWIDYPGFENTRGVAWEPVRRVLGGDVIIKDYVKSEKGNPDLFILKKELTNDEFADRIQQFIDARGKLFNKGIVFKEVAKLKKYDGQTNEWRMFFLNKTPIGVNLNTEQKLNFAMPTVLAINKLEEVNANIASNFFTMDIAEKEDGTWMILEMGDGQVSGLAAHQEPIKLYTHMYNVLNKI